jgi:hypothetical protein
MDADAELRHQQSDDQYWPQRYGGNLRDDKNPIWRYFET